MRYLVCGVEDCVFVWWYIWVLIVIFKFVYRYVFRIGVSFMINYLIGVEVMVCMLEVYGVMEIFGLCGDMMLLFYDVLVWLDYGINYFLMWDECYVVYMVDGYVWVIGKFGVCEGLFGGGVIYILFGVVEVNESFVLILVIIMDVVIISCGKYLFMELD